MQRRLAAILLLILALAPPAETRAQATPPADWCAEMLTECRTAWVNLLPWHQVPLTLEGWMTCAQFCLAQYRLRHARTGQVLMEYGSPNGLMGPDLLAWGFGSAGSGPRTLFVRTVTWRRPPNPAVQDGWYEDTLYRWDESWEQLVRGETRRWEFGQWLEILRALMEDRMELVFPHRIEMLFWR